MYLVMGITGKVGGATARHLLKQGNQVEHLCAIARKGEVGGPAELVDETGTMR